MGGRSVSRSETVPGATFWFASLSESPGTCNTAATHLPSGLLLSRDPRLACAVVFSQWGCA